MNHLIGTLIVSQKETFSALPDVVACELDGGAALLDLRTSLYFSLNSVGGVLWQALQTPATLDDLVLVVADKFEVSAETCRNDVDVYLRDLAARHLISVQQA